MMNAQLSAQFEQQITLKRQSYTAAQRELLTKVLDEKYKHLSVSEKLKSNLNRLKEPNTFTVTTGHQLCLMTGPLYFIYKILHVIKLSEDLNNTFPNEHFVPVYWMASEDHDFEEIRSFLLFGQKWTWESKQKGAVGQFNTNDLQQLLQALAEKFQNQPDSEIHSLIAKFKAPNYGLGFFEFVHELFSVYGLVIIDADNTQLKESAWPIWQKDLYTADMHEALVKNTQELREKGLPTPIESKETNLFVLSEQRRERIEKTGPIQFEKEHSFQLSPNVVLRPIYQEWILPNLAYIGGPSEIAYWQQLPLAFQTIALPFPLTLQRAGGILLQQKDLELIQKLGFEKQDFLADKAILKERYLKQAGDQEPNYAQLDEFWSGYKASFLNIVAEELPQERRMIEAELTRIQKQTEALEEKFEKMRKAKFDKALKQIEQLSEKLQPKGQLQERTTNILNYCPDGALSSKIARIYEQLDPYSQEKQWFVVS
jgi:bacillithiol biosynthesis cysteine-adding enzyme BshC